VNEEWPNSEPFFNDLVSVDYVSAMPELQIPILAFISWAATAGNLVAYPLLYESGPELEWLENKQLEFIDSLLWKWFWSSRRVRVPSGRRWHPMHSRWFEGKASEVQQKAREKLLPHLNAVPLPSTPDAFDEIYNDIDGSASRITTILSDTNIYKKYMNNDQYDEASAKLNSIIDQITPALAAQANRINI